jgi:hypothetical protein
MWHLILKSEVQSQITSHEIPGEQSGPGAGSFSVSSGFLANHHSAIFPQSSATLP